MTERIKLSLSGMWLLVSLFALLFPIFLPSVADSANPAENVIGMANATMFILSFPASLFAVPFMMIAGYVIDPNSIQGMYLNLFLLFILGLVQWFWIVPCVWRQEPQLQTLNLPLSKIIELPEMIRIIDFEIFDERDRTPVERIIYNDDDDDDTEAHT